MSLRSPISVIPAAQVGSAHFIAIGGSGMSGVAEMFHALGIPTSGCDQADSPTLRQLAAQGITTYIGHDPAQLAGVDTVVVSSAIRASNPELVAARQKGLRVWHRSAALASLMIGQHGVSVAGTHGKTTTTGMIAVMLSAVGADPSYVIGAPLAASGVSAHRGHGDVFVIEADESDGSFLQYPTEIAVITNVEADHLDNWGTPRHYSEGFLQFATGASVRAVVINGDDPGAHTLAEQLRQDTSHGVSVLTYGESEGCDLRLTDLRFAGTSGRAVLHSGGTSYDLALQVPGRHNLANAAASFATGRLLGLDADQLLAGAASFTGTLRRFQLIAQVGVDGGEVRIVDDYAHHPTEIRAALSAARRVANGGRLIACFQPHLYSRTVEFATEFGQALTLADQVVLTDIYAAREDPMPGVSGQLVADAARRAGAQVVYEPDKTQLPGLLASLVQGGDLVMTLGAGDITLVGPMLAKLLSAQHGEQAR